MLSLADSSIRMYRKKNGLISLRLKSYLLVHTEITFSLHAYLKYLTCQITLPSGLVVPMDYSFTRNAQAEYTLNTMMHLFWAWGEAEMENMKNTVAKLKVDYRISFTGHPYEEPESFEMIVPLIVKTWNYKGH